MRTNVFNIDARPLELLFMDSDLRYDSTNEISVSTIK